MKEIIDSLELITIQNFCFAKNNDKIMRRQAMGCEKIFAIDPSDKDCYPKFTKKSQNNNKKTIQF